MGQHKTSVKRQAILNCLRATSEHPSAEMLYDRLKPDFPDLSLGTVYRNLSLFTREGYAQVACHFNGKERFDGRLDTHAHYVCKTCGKVFDLNCTEETELLFQKLSAAGDFFPESCSITFCGICSTCSDVR